MHHQGGTRKNGQKAWTASEILDEVQRLPGSAEHVDPWGESPQIIPGAVATFDELRAAHAAAATVKETFDYTGKDGSKSTRSRKLRKDARSLYTSVFSLPVETAEARRDPMLRERCLSVIEEAIAHERARLESLGGMVLMSVAHWDERHVHAHMLAIDSERGRVNALHPGTAAKEAFVSDPRHRGLMSKKERNRADDRAYKRAMREWQDELHQSVFAPAGLLRVGPRRGRLSRAEYMHAKHAASEQQEDGERQRDLAEREADLIEFNRSMLGLMDQDLAQQREWNQAAAARSRQLNNYEDELLQTRAEVERERDDAVRREAQARAREAQAQEREKRAAERERKAERHARQVELKARNAEKKEAEADASLAAIEAVVDGVADVVEVDGVARLKRTAQADETLWTAVRERMSRAPDVARTIAGRVWQRLDRLRSRAAVEGREMAGQEARVELSERFDQLEAAWLSTNTLRTFLDGIVKQLPPTLRATIEGEEAQQDTRRAVTANVRARRVAKGTERE